MQSEQLISKLEALIATGHKLSVHDASSQYTKAYSSQNQYSEACGWVASVQNVLSSLFNGRDISYSIQIERHIIGMHDAKAKTFTFCKNITSILEALLSDLEGGYLGSITYSVNAEVFDDFLEHASHYAKEKKHKESGVIVGVVFEDTIKKICEKHEIEVPSDKLEQHINALKKEEVLSGTKAKRCKTASDVRGNAAHAKWDAYDLSDVKEAVNLTRELIADHLE